MKIKMLTLAAAVIAACSPSIVKAEEPMTGPDLNMTNTTESTPAAQTPTDTPWYLNLDYEGFNFEVPAGSIVDKGSSLMVKYPDGTFGVSMTNTEAKGVNQARAVEICQRNAVQMHLANPKVEKITCGKAKGAIASGMTEGQEITIIILPHADSQLSTIIIATPGRREWVDHFVASLKK
ncbi:MAG: hypothetical protein NC204_02380 [Candidatus Amulumruptor caecigallinarius]|nr:hypothetical protein [Candidatus Amulumruptor caecigallinarius]